MGLREPEIGGDHLYDDYAVRSMTPDEIRAQVMSLQSDTVQGEDDAWQALKPLGIEVVPYLLEAYPKMGKWQGRASLVYHAVKFARVSEDAYQLGVSALGDRARIVRYRACGLVAYSLRKDAIPYLKPLLESDCEETREHAHAAIDAIRAKNHHYFVDRGHTGRAFWVVNKTDKNEKRPRFFDRWLKT